MSMWLLWIIVLSPFGSTESVVMEYRTEKLCGIEKIRMELEFHKAYAGENDYRFVCRKKGLIT